MNRGQMFAIASFAHPRIHYHGRFLRSAFSDSIVRRAIRNALCGVLCVLMKGSRRSRNDPGADAFKFKPQEVSLYPKPERQMPMRIR